MAPKQKQKKAEEDVFQLEPEHQQQQKPEKVDLQDTAALKRALDDAVIQAVTEAGHTMDNRYTDAKIVLGLLACAVACLAQFYPKKYPDNTWLLVACVSTYVVLSSLMTVVAMIYEKDAIAFTRPVPGGPPALVIASRMPRFQELYTLRIGHRVACAGANSGGGSSDMSLTKSVGTYFHEDGQLAAEVIKKDAAELLRSATEGKTK